MPYVRLATNTRGLQEQYMAKELIPVSTFTGWWCSFSPDPATLFLLIITVRLKAHRGESTEKETD